MEEEEEEEEGDGKEKVEKKGVEGGVGSEVVVEVMEKNGEK